MVFAVTRAIAAAVSPVRDSFELTEDDFFKAKVRLFFEEKKIGKVGRHNDGF